MEKIKCIGCGAEIQTEDLTKEGYLPQSVLEKKDVKEIICHRCFRLKHYNIVEKSAKSDADFVNELEKIDKKNSLFVYIVDSFDLEGSLVYRVNRILQESQILLVLNKIDLYPANTNFNHLLNTVNKELKEFGIKVQEKILLSAKSDINIDVLIHYINRTSCEKIYFIGCTNTGKSTIINKVLRQLFDQDHDYITTKNMIGTTLSTIEIPYKNKWICDTPGIINHKQLFNYVDKQELAKVVPVKRIKPRSYQMKEKSVLLIENFLLFKYIQGNISGFTFYINNPLNIHKTNEIKGEEQLFSEKISNFKFEKNEVQHHKFDLVLNTKHKIVIAGLGFISCYGQGKLEIKTFKEVGVYLKSGHSTN